MKFFVHVPEGERFPRGYGVAWRTLVRPGCTAAPVPLNLIVRFARSLWLRAAVPRINNLDTYQVGYDKGFADARSLHRGDRA